VHHRPKLSNKSIVVSSFGKSFHITGWKIGYLIAPDFLMSEIKKVHQFLVFSVNSVAQYALNDYLNVVDVSKLAYFYQQKRDYFIELLRDSRFVLLPCEGTYFLTAFYDAISKEQDIQFSKRLVTDFGVATIPFSPFYTNRTERCCIRFCFAKEDTTLENAAKILRKI
jgi:methionine aminotransferase